jgi:uncharacterized methyltransferase DUF6094
MSNDGTSKQFGTIENLISGGYFPTVANGVENLAKLIQPLNSEEGQFGRVLDPTAGYGNAVMTFAHRLNIDAYAVEENAERGNTLVDRIGMNHAVFGNMYDMTITKGSMSALFLNPPYFKAEDGERVEHQMVQKAFYWLKAGGIAVIIIYRHNVNPEFLQWLWRRSKNIVPFYVEHQPGYKREYEQIALVCKLGETPRHIEEIDDNNYFKSTFTNWFKQFVNPAKIVIEEYQQTQEDWPKIYIEALDQYVPDPNFVPQLIEEESLVTPFPFKDESDVKFGAARLGEAMAEMLASDIDLLDVAIAAEGKPMFELPATVSNLKTFQPTVFSDEQQLEASKSFGVTHLPTLQEALLLKEFVPTLEPPTEMRMRQAGGLIASGAVGTVPFTGEDGIRHYVKSSTSRETAVVDTEEVLNDDDGKVDKVVATVQDRPKTTIVTINENGEIEEIADDEGLQEFVRDHAMTFLKEVKENYPPIWSIEDERKEELFALTQDVLARGVHEMTETQRHVSSAMFATLQERRGVILVGEMGTGKSLEAIATMSMMRDTALSIRFSTRKSRKQGNAVIMPGEVVTMLVPPITSENWKDEIEGGLKKAGNVEIFTFDTDATYEDFNDMDVVSLKAKEAGTRCKAAWAAGEEPSEEDIRTANVIIFAIFTETVAKLQEGWTHAVVPKRPYREPGKLGVVSGRLGEPATVYTDPTSGRGLVASRKGREVSYATEAMFSHKKNGSAKGNKRWFGRGDMNRTTKYIGDISRRFKGDEKALEEAREKDEAKVTEFNSMMENNDWFVRRMEGHDSREETQKAHLTTIRYIESKGSRFANWKYLCASQSDIPENFEDETRRSEKRIKYYRSFEQQERHNIRNRRAGHDSANTPLTALWQESRLRSNITYDDGQMARERINRVPLPSIMAAHNIPEEDYVIGKADDWKQGRPVSMSDYFLRRFAGRIALFVGDELHQYKSGAGTGRGIVMTRFVNAARKSIGLTGTVYGGKASSVFHLLFLFSEEVRQQYPDPNNASVMNQWIRDMGVLEYTITTTVRGKDGAKTNAKPVEGTPREAPGASPLLLKVLLNVAIFVGMKDMGKKLVRFSQIPVPIEMSWSERQRFCATENKLTGYLLECLKDGDGSFAGAYFQALMGLTSASHRQENVYHTKRISRVDWLELKEMSKHMDIPIAMLHPDEDGSDPLIVKVKILVASIPPLPYKHVSSKERWLLQMIEGELERGRNVCVYVSQTATKDIQPRIKEMIEGYSKDANVLILPKSISTKKRAAYINQKAKEGVNVLICNPKMVEVGINMLDFPTLCFYEVAYSLYIMSQASRRAFRLNQDKECIVYYPYNVKFKNEAIASKYIRTMEERAVNMVGRKERAAAFLAGEEGAGLSALADSDSNDLQKEIMKQITSNANASESEFVDTRLIFDDINRDEEEHIVPTYEDGLFAEERLNDVPAWQAAGMDDAEKEMNLDSFKAFISILDMPGDEVPAKEVLPEIFQSAPIEEAAEQEEELGIMPAIEALPEPVEEEVAAKTVIELDIMPELEIEEVPEPAIEEAPVCTDLETETLAQQIAAEIEAEMAEMETDDVFTPDYNFKELFKGFVSSLPSEKRGAVIGFMSKKAEYPGAGRINRRFFVERSAEALFECAKLDEPQGSIKYAIGDFGATSSEVMYLEFIYRQCGIRDLKDGSEIRSDWDVDMSHADILKAS